MSTMLQQVLGGAAIAMATASIVVLLTTTDHDLGSAAMIGMMLSIATVLYLLIDRRMTRVETGMNRIATAERDVLQHVRDRVRLN